MADSEWEIISEERELQQCQKMLKNILLKKYSPQIFDNVKVPYPGGSYTGSVYAFSKLNNLWYAHDDGYWNAFGIKDGITDKSKVDILVEINSPITGIYRRTHGVFIKKRNNILLGHRGGFGGGWGKKNIGKEESFDLIQLEKQFKGKIIDNVIDGDKRASIIVISNKSINSIKNNDLQFGKDLYGFVYSIQQMKEKRKAENEGIYVYNKNCEFSKLKEKKQQKEKQEDEILLSYIRNNKVEEVLDEIRYVPKPEKRDKAVNGYYPRNKMRALKALKRANYKCEIDEEHSSFIRKSDHTVYMEPHHLIPMAFQDGFENSLDVQANIISLCSNCHNELHYGDEFEILLKDLYTKREKQLDKAGIKITYAKLVEMYQ